MPKPIDHPEFFRLAPPPGASRESSILLDRAGTFWHEGERVVHPAMRRAFAGWLRRHPDNGRFILSNGYDWTYLTVQGTPFFVEAVRPDALTQLQLELSDGSTERLDAGTLTVDADGSLYARVKSAAFEARFTPQAQLQLAPWVVDAGTHPALQLGDQALQIPLRDSDPNSCSG